MPEERLSTAFSDVADVASVKTGDQLPLVVGGQAREYLDRCATSPS